MGNVLGRLFRISTFGESHGPAIGVVIDGCPPRLTVTAGNIQRELDRRRPGQSKLTTQRQEPDQVQILSGVENDQTTGTALALLIANKDARSRDYESMQNLYRPSHADYTYEKKYGIRSQAGGGRASARETVARVAAGAVAAQVLRQEGIEVLSWVQSVRDIHCIMADDEVSLTQIESNPVRCPSPLVAKEMAQAIDAARLAGDSLGGVIRCVVRHVPCGLGAPVFDKLEADLAKGLMSIPAAKGFEVGSGFRGTTMTGREHNDEFYQSETGTRTRTNHSGGIQGGISNGEDILLRVAFKPTATILTAQKTVDSQGNSATLKPKGRHDPCVLPRAVPIVDAMVRLVLTDHLLLHRAQVGPTVS